MLQDQKIQRCLADYMYGVTHIIPALLAQLQAETSKADMLGIGAAGVAGTLSVMVGFDAALHWENAQDPDYSCGICLGAKDDSLTPLGAFDFALPALNNGRGIVVENGPGVMMIWMGKKTTHGTSFRWVEKRETGDSAPRAGEELDLRGGARNAGRGGPAGNTRSRAVPRNGRRAGVCQWQKGSTMARAKSKGKQAVVRPEGSKKGGAKKRAVGVSLDVGSGVGMPLNYGR